MRTKTLIFAGSLVLMLAGLVSNATGQVLGQPYRISDREVQRLLDRIKKESDEFRKSLDEALDKSRLNGTRREDEINAFVKAFDEETKRLRDNFDHHKSTAQDVSSVLDRAARIDGIMTRRPYTPRAQGDWTVVRADLEQLAGTYSVSWRWGGESVSGPVVADLPYRITDKEVEEIIHRIEHQSDEFRKSLDHALDRSRFNGTRREDNINEFVKDFYKETKALHDNFDHHRSTSNDVQTVLDRAAQINQFMGRNRLDRQTENEWSTLKANLDDLARVYNVNWRWGM